MTSFHISSPLLNGTWTVVQISSADVAELQNYFQGPDLTCSPRQLGGQDRAQADQQFPGQTEVEPISARTPYNRIYTLGSSPRFARAQRLTELYYGIILRDHITK